MKMEQIVVRGIAERLLFEAPDSDYRVFRLHDEDDDATYTVTGHGTKPLVGDRLEVKGHWVQHKRYGRQFAADGWSRIIPESVDGIERFLGSGAVKGMGPALAHRVVAAFGKDTMAVLEKTRSGSWKSKASALRSWLSLRNPSMKKNRSTTSPMTWNSTASPAVMPAGSCRNTATTSTTS